MSVTPATPVPPASPPTLAPLVCRAGERPASSPRVWRLSAAQYSATMRALAAGFDPTTGTNPFGVLTGGARFTTDAESAGMPELAADQLLRSSAAAAPRVVGELKRTVPCLKMPVVAGSCVQGALASLGRRAFRRPLADDEVAPYADAAVAALATDGVDEALGVVVEAMLSSPFTVFRTELGAGVADGAGRLRLTAHEVASAVSYTVNDAPPDAMLSAAADEGRLGTPEEMRVQVLRLWGAPAAGLVVDRFLKEYFHYDLATTVFKDSSPTFVHRPAMLVTDTAAFVQDLFALRKGFLRKLLTAGVGFVEQATSAAYGVSLAAGSMGKQKVEFPAGQRFGILTHPSFLAAQSHNDANDPIKRGRFVRESLLCQPVPSIPIGVVPVLPDLGPTATVREKLAAHTQGTCATCHSLMDPMGFTLEQYDHYGRHRTIESGRPVDTTGSLAGLGPAPISLTGPRDLATFLGESAQVRECFVRHGFRFLLGRSESGADECALVAAIDALAKPDGDVVEAMTALLASESFLYRTRPVVARP